ITGFRTDEIGIWLECRDMIKNNTQHTHEGNGKHHSGYSPQQFTSHQCNNGKQRIDPHLTTHDQRLQYVSLHKLHHHIYGYNTQSHVRASALCSYSQYSEGST